MPTPDDGPQPVVRVAAVAMATRFEIALHGPRPEALRAAAEEALAEVARVEAWLSPYLPHSTLSRVHRDAQLQPVVVEPPVFDFLRLAALETPSRPTPRPSKKPKHASVGIMSD